MPRLDKPLDKKQFERELTGTDQKLAVGHGLYLHVRGSSKLWVHQYRDGASFRATSLGRYPEMSLYAARQQRETFAALRRAGRIERRGIATRNRADEPMTAAAAPKRARFADTLKVYIALNRPKWKGEQEAHRYGKIGNGSLGPLWIDEITTPDVEKYLRTLALTTADKDRMRIMGVINYAVAKGLRADGPNPARKEVIKHLIADAPKGKPRPALPLEMLPAFMADLAADKTPEAHALGFLILTATRTQEARDAEWSEIDTSKMLWSIPASRMKEGIAHDVPLSPAALALLGKPGTGRIFGKMGDDALLDKLQALRGNGYTAHGFRSTFMSFAVKGGYSKDLRDRALAHAVKGATDAAYDRERLVEERRPLMNAWATFATSGVAR
jgi:integrase